MVSATAAGPASRNRTNSRVPAAVRPVVTALRKLTDDRAAMAKTSRN